MTELNTRGRDQSESLSVKLCRISKYEVVEFLGGGMSNVFRARDVILQREVAIKTLTPAGLANPELKARFLFEARVAANLSHENIMSVYDLGEENGQPYMVMELVRGFTLRAAIERNLLGDYASKLRIALQLASALEYLHQHKDGLHAFSQVTHRDLKPENVMIDNFGHLKLMDFGIARTPYSTLTSPGYVLGTPHYMAPEQILGKPATPAVDIYAFGIIFYEIMLGVRPYTDDPIRAVFSAEVREPLNILPLSQAGVTSRVCALIEHCTLKDPSARWEIGKVIAELKCAITEPEAPPVGKPWDVPRQRTPRQRLPLAAIALVLTLSLAGAPAAHHGRSTPPALPNRNSAAVSGSLIRIDSPAVPEPISTAAPDPAPLLVASPSQLAWRYQVGSPALPDSKGIEITAGGAQIEFIVRCNAKWLTADHNSGVTPARMAVAIRPNGLEPGRNYGTIEIKTAGNPNTGLVIYAAVDVLPRPFAAPPRPDPPAPVAHDLPEPPALNDFQQPSGPSVEPVLLSPIPPASAPAQHFLWMGRRSPGTVSFSQDSVRFLDVKGLRFEAPLRRVTVECGAECIVTIPLSSSGHRERLAVAPQVAAEFQSYLSQIGQTVQKSLK